jgi:hypothetical protein
MSLENLEISLLIAEKTAFNREDGLYSRIKGEGLRDGVLIAENKVKRQLL